MEKKQKERAVLEEGAGCREKDQIKVVSVRVKRGYPVNSNRGFCIGDRGEPLCIIYNSSLQGRKKITKQKKTDSVAYIHI